MRISDESGLIKWYAGRVDILLLRHGIATSAATSTVSDEDRPLTDEGIDKMLRAAKGMHQVVKEIDLILTSPFRRTVETAEIVAAQFPEAGNIKTCSELALGGSAKRILETVVSYDRFKSVLLVGHEPEMVEMFSLLSGARSGAIEYKRGALSLFSILDFGTHPRAVLRWHLTSKQLRAIGAQ